MAFISLENLLASLLFIGGLIGATAIIASALLARRPRWFKCCDCDQFIDSMTGLSSSEPGGPFDGGLCDLCASKREVREAQLMNKRNN